MTTARTKRLKIATVSLNQTVYDYATNVPHLQKAIDFATADHADLLATEELSVVAYPADDYHQWNKNNDNVWNYLQLLARYAAEKDPNLVLSVGVPWHYADKTKPVTDPEYNIDDRPYNIQAVIAGGRVVAMTAKTILADGAAEYEPRQFHSWPVSKGTIDLILPDGHVIPFGKPVMALGTAADHVTLVHEICADGWSGVHDNKSVDRREQAEGRYIAVLAKTTDLSVVINASASKPEPAINKEALRVESLCKTGAQHCGVFVYVNFLGSASGTYAAEGSQIYAQGDQILHQGKRYSFKDVSYSSLSVDVPTALRGTASIIIPHHFQEHRLHQRVGGRAKFDKAHAALAISDDELVYEEYMRSIALWLRDYLAKPHRNSQGYVVSLSGGKDSAAGATAVALMVKLEVQENGIDGFFERFHKLKYKDEVLKIYKTSGEAAAVDAIMSNILTCVYLPTQNSSPDDEAAAQLLIEGGVLPDGSRTKGIGGKFYVAPVQALLEEATVAFTGLDLSQVIDRNIDAILGAELKGLSKSDRAAVGRARTLALIGSFVNGDTKELPNYITDNCVNRVPSWANPADDLTLQNIQARVRLPIPWAIANLEGKMALVTSNESELVHSYTTGGGDMHMGGANPIGGVPKHVITQALIYLEEKGLVGLLPMRALSGVNKGASSARLRKVVAGAVEQTDEKDLGFTYQQSHFIEKRLLVLRETPDDVLAEMRESPLFPSDLGKMRTILSGFAKRWESGQFKRIMGTLAPHVGSNVDPHQAIRTTVLGDHFRTGIAHMTLHILAETLGGDAPFSEHYGVSLHAAKIYAGMNDPFKTTLITAPLPDLLRKDAWRGFESSFEDIAPYLAELPTLQSPKETSAPFFNIRTGHHL